MGQGGTLIHVAFVTIKDVTATVGIWIWLSRVRVLERARNVNRVVRKFSSVDEFWIFNGE